jgi:8-oxo-dGTP pyrophosphatase MutT (NUDIX family)
MLGAYLTTSKPGKKQKPVRDSSLDIWQMPKTKTAATAVVPTPAAKVELESPKKKRKKWPFQGFIDFQGLKIHVENKAGSYRSGKGKDGKPWKTYMKYHYGEIAGTTGSDGDALDAYVGPNAHSPLVVVVHQQDPDTGKYDEDKVMLGWTSVQDALKAYRGQYSKPGFYGSHTAMPIGKLLAWCADKSKYKEKVAMKGQDTTDKEKVAFGFYGMAAAYHMNRRRHDDDDEVAGVAAQARTRAGSAPALKVGQKVEVVVVDGQVRIVPVGGTPSLSKRAALESGPNLRHRVELVVVDNKGHILLGRNPRRGSHQFPGGGIDGGSVNAAAKREAEEEAGIAVGRVRGVGRRPDIHLSPDIKPGYDGTKTFWRTAPHAGKNTERLGADNDAMTELKFHHPSAALALIGQSKDDMITPQRAALLRRLVSRHPTDYPYAFKEKEAMLSVAVRSLTSELLKTSAKEEVGGVAAGGLGGALLGGYAGKRIAENDARKAVTEAASDLFKKKPVIGFFGKRYGGKAIEGVAAEAARAAGPVGKKLGAIGLGMLGASLGYAVGHVAAKDGKP